MKLTAEQIKQALEFCANCECNDEKTEKECALINMSFCKNYLRKQSLDYINRLEAENSRLQAQIEALQMDNNQLQSDIICANQNYEHMKELWNAEKESVKRANERFFNTNEKLKTFASHNANLERKLEAQRFSLAVHKEEIEKLQAKCSILKQKRVNIFERIEIVEKSRADAIKEFAERFLKKVHDNHYLLSDRNNSKGYGMFIVGIEQAVNETKEEMAGKTE